MSSYILVDCMNSVTSEDDFPVLELESDEQLRAELAHYRSRRPSIVHLRNSEGDIIAIGVSDTFGALKWMRSGERQFLKIALANEIVSKEGIDFREQGADTGFRSKYLIPIDKVIEAVVHFYGTGKMPSWVHWSSWNPESSRMEAELPNEDN